MAFEWELTQRFLHPNRPRKILHISISLCPYEWELNNLTPDFDTSSHTRRNRMHIFRCGFGMQTEFDIRVDECENPVVWSVGLDSIKWTAHISTPYSCSKWIESVRLLMCLISFFLFHIIHWIKANVLCIELYLAHTHTVCACICSKYVNNRQNS